MKALYLILSLMLCTAGLSAQAPWIGDLSGTITKHNLDMTECKVSEMQIKYHLYTQVGETGVNLRIEWQTSGQDPDCLAGKMIYYVIRCHTANPGAYAGELYLNAGSGGTVKSAGQGFGYDLSGSPDYSALFLTGYTSYDDPNMDIDKILNNKFSYIDQATALVCWKAGLVIDDIDAIIQKNGSGAAKPATSTATTTTPTSSSNQNSSSTANNNGGSSSSSNNNNTQSSTQNRSSGTGTNSNSQSTSGYYNNSQSNSQQAAKQQQMQARHDEIINTYHQQVAAINQANQAMTNSTNQLVDAIGQNYEREQAKNNAYADARERENEEKHKERLREIEEETKRDKETSEKWNKVVSDITAEQEKKRADESANIRLWHKKSLSILPESISLTLLMPDQVTDPNLKSVFYVIWNFVSPNFVLISKPIEIRKSPDGDWPVSTDFYDKVHTSSILRLDMTPDIVSFEESSNSLNYLLGYFKSESAAQSAINSIKAKAVSQSYTVLFR